ncbi:hypothetical protein EZV62_015351 [Acer yangbiense]|uniref:Fe2OG dioxygenase domain-containing protein n=1 Tax=Acer yangbiense TaxID=1000413 RepID=A0A5C7HMC6_9ROSI|nr:hypothetical protein EZV62_015351 [Acer yangbiense]
MVDTRSVDHTDAEAGSGSVQNRDLKAFDDQETTVGVKGLVDSKLTKIPQKFIHDDHNQQLSSGDDDHDQSKFSIPIIDLDHENSSRTEIIKQLKDACEKWGFFQVVNHGIPISILDEMIDGIRRFHEQDTEAKKKFFTPDNKSHQKVSYNTNFDVHKAKAANWRDSLSCVMAPIPPHLDELPEICRDTIIEYTKRTMELSMNLFGLLSDALGLDTNHLKNMGCAEGLYFLGHYYPPCPEPELTMGTSSHTDSSFLTVLLQDHIGGLQVLHQNHWVHVTPIHGDFQPENSRKLFGPIEELLSEENQQIYKETTMKEFLYQKYSLGLGGISALEHFKMRSN